MRGRPLCCFCLFFLIFQVIIIRGFQLGKDWNPSLLEESVEDGSVITVSGNVYHTEIKKENLVVYLTAKEYQTKIIVYIKQQKSTDKHISIGNEIEVTGEVAYFDTPRNPGNFDQKFYYQKQGIHGSIFAKKCRIINASKDWWKESLAQLRIRWKGALVNALGENHGNTMSAILLGDKSELDSDLKELYQKNGIGHVLAISGLHMTFIGLGLYQFLRKRGLSFVSAGIIGIIFLVSYSMMIGNGVASVRALVMFIVRIGADMTGRVYDMLTALALAAIVILCWRPLYLYDAGFLLSFGAILGVLLVNQIFPQFKKKKGKEFGDKRTVAPSGMWKDICMDTGKNVWNGICASISINLTILPCMLYFYYEFPTYSILVNLLVIPLMSVVLGVGVIGTCICNLLPWIGGKILWMCKPILELYEAMCEIGIRMPGSRIVTGKPEIWQMVVYYVLFTTVLFFLYKDKKKQDTENNVEMQSILNISDLKEKKKRKLIIGIASVVLINMGILLLCVRWKEVLNFSCKTSITMLDVGQGDGLVLKSPEGLTCMIDGGSSDVSEVGKYRIEPYLKSQGIAVLDYVFISHGDLDHYSGIEEMLQRQRFGVRIRYLVLPRKEVLDEKLKSLAMLATKYQTEVVCIQQGESISDGAWQLSCLQPGVDYDGEIGNASSMVLSLSYGAFDMLFTGDVEGEGEEYLKENLSEWMEANRVEYEVLKVAHHGSKNSSEQTFLSLVKPEIALISAGRDNRYGHPHQETIKKLEAMGCQILNTQMKGAVTIQTDGERINYRIFTES